MIQKIPQPQWKDGIPWSAGCPHRTWRTRNDWRCSIDDKLCHSICRVVVQKITRRFEHLELAEKALTEDIRHYGRLVATCERGAVPAVVVYQMDIHWRAITAPMLERFGMDDADPLQTRAATAAQYPAASKE